MENLGGCEVTSQSGQQSLVVVGDSDSLNSNGELERKHRLQSTPCSKLILEQFVFEVISYNKDIKIRRLGNLGGFYKNKTFLGYFKIHMRDLWCLPGWLVC